MTPSNASVSRDIIAVMARLTAAGVRLAPDGSNLRYWSPVTLAPELRELIVTHKPAIRAALSAWCPKRAELLEHEADELVERLGVPGTDPVIVAAAAQCVEAQGRRDMLAVRLAVFVLETRARALAAQRELVTH